LGGKLVLTDVRMALSEGEGKGGKAEEENTHGKILTFEEGGGWHSTTAFYLIKGGGEEETARGREDWTRYLLPF